MIKRILLIMFSLLAAAVILIPISLFYILNNGNPYHKHLVNKHIPQHLEELGYSEEDIIEHAYLQPKHLINNDVYHGHYKVVFADEPQLEYLYGVTKKGKNVVQFCEKETLLGPRHYGEMTTDESNHSEEFCIGYFDNRD
ncbi:DUF3139 domain-containing protein [Alkalihalophilus pseudofirmus]|uniref:DUF3139 domain-containing protein n=1 Tax=Alkalihalophilus pseudofirmus TaxID=79885 RepID=A0AAJ2KWV1_ALKPS|nr:DUF3139 domain-containing protein [Alkalihalophilus pseudofirmus]MDV2884530.1 DUF3139 domain-containing protein [Alkalihalophilus pseudofirmus]WEG18773.1 DUF3139 domain-containing protein [Alkalihalophilus pseudofirmus]